jgi:hypothetical protein
MPSRTPLNIDVVHRSRHALEIGHSPLLEFFGRHPIFGIDEPSFPDAVEGTKGPVVLPVGRIPVTGNAHGLDDETGGKPGAGLSEDSHREDNEHEDEHSQDTTQHLDSPPDPYKNSLRFLRPPALTGWTSFPAHARHARCATKMADSESIA